MEADTSSEKAEASLLELIRAAGTTEIELTVVCPNGRWMVAVDDLYSEAHLVGHGATFREVWFNQKAAGES